MGRPPKQTTSLKEYFSSGVNKKRWEEAKARAASRGKFEEFDDGKYRVKVVDALVNRSESSGRLQHVLTFKFVDGDYKGKTVRQYQGVDNDTGLEILIGTLTRMGYAVEDPEDIQDTIDKKIKKEQPEIEIRIKTNGEYQNIIVTKALEEESEEEENESDDDDTETKTESDESESESASEDSEDDDEDDDEDGEEATEEEDSEDDEDEEEKPKTSKKPKPAKTDDEDEEAEDAEETEETEAAEEEKVELEEGVKISFKMNDKILKGEIIKVLEERKDGTGTLRVKSLKTGKKYQVAVPDDVVDIIS